MPDVSFLDDPLEADRGKGMTFSGAARTVATCSRGKTGPLGHRALLGGRGSRRGHRRVVRDWLDGIRDSREPLASGERALKAIEMAHGVFAAGIHG